MLKMPKVNPRPRRNPAHGLPPVSDMLDAQKSMKFWYDLVRAAGAGHDVPMEEIRLQYRDRATRDTFDGAMKAVDAAVSEYALEAEMSGDDETATRLRRSLRPLRALKASIEERSDPSLRAHMTEYHAALMQHIDASSQAAQAAARAQAAAADATRRAPLTAAEEELMRLSESLRRMEQDYRNWLHSDDGRTSGQSHPERVMSLRNLREMKAEAERRVDALRREFYRA